MLREILAGVSGSAAVLAVDLFVIRWSSDSNATRAAVAVGFFVLAFFSAKMLTHRANASRAVLSENEVNGTMIVNAKEVSAPSAEKLLSSNKTGADFSVKADKISS